MYEPVVERLIQLEGAVNFRDLGGYSIAGGGQTRWGRVFRSDSLHLLTERDLLAFQRLGVRTVYDLRGEGERGREPDLVPSRHVPLMSPRPQGPDGLRHLQAGIDAERRLFAQYRDMVANAGPLFGQMFRELAAPGGVPALFHCAGGKDRTGLTAALLLTALGVDRETVLDDYELTSQLRTEAHEQPLIEKLLALGASRSAISGLLSTPRWVMADVLDSIDREHGGIDAYLLGPARLPTTALVELRSSLTEDQVSRAVSPAPRRAV